MTMHGYEVKKVFKSTPKTLDSTGDVWQSPHTEIVALRAFTR